MELLRKHGDLSTVECVVKQWYQQKQEQRQEGGWHSRISLSNLGWSEFGSYPTDLCVCVWGMFASFGTCMYAYHLKSPLAAKGDDHKCFNVGPCKGLHEDQ